MAFESVGVLFGPIAAGAGDVSVPAANTAATITYPGANGNAHILHEILWAYSGSGTLAGGNIIIQDGSTTVFSEDVTNMGAGFLPLIPPIKGIVGNSLTVTLAAGGANVSGKLNLRHSTMPGSTVVSGGMDFSLPMNSGELVPLGVL